MVPWTSGLFRRRDTPLPRTMYGLIYCSTVAHWVAPDSESRPLQWRRHGREWVGPDPAPPTPVQTPPEICANLLKKVLYIGGVPCMYIVTFYCSPAKKNCSDPTTIFGLATPLDNYPHQPAIGGSAFWEWWHLIYLFIYLIVLEPVEGTRSVCQCFLHKWETRKISFEQAVWGNSPVFPYRCHAIPSAHLDSKSVEIYR